MVVGVSGRTESDWQSSGYSSAKEALGSNVGGVADPRVLGTPSEGVVPGLGTEGGLAASTHTEGEDVGLEAHLKFCTSGMP